MCSRNDEGDEPQSCMEEKQSLMWTEVCQKCSEKKPVIQILQIKHAYCRDCFLAHINHKFRSSLGKSKMMKPSDFVMAAFSGSVKSHVLLHLLHAGFSENSHKRFLFKSKILYIDEGAVLGISIPDRTSNLRAIADIVDRFGFSAYFTSLSCLFNKNGPLCSFLNRSSTLNVEEKLEEDLHHLFENTGSLTAKEDLLKQLRKNLLLRCAKELECGKIFTADTSTDLAIQILTDVSLGRGAEMHHDVSFHDGQDKDVKILRPLLELSSKESAFYSVYHKLDGVFIPSLCTKAASDQSIHNLSKHFVMDLMENFPSTVSTIFRTGGKLGSSSSPSEDKENSCLFCQVRLDADVVPCSSSQATKFSRLVSSLGPLGFDNKSLTCLPHSAGNGSNCSPNTELCCSNSNVQCKCEKGQDTMTPSDIEEWCCYSCRLILYDMKSASALPANIVETARTRKSLQGMRNSIKDFLL